MFAIKGDETIGGRRKRARMRFKALVHVVMQNYEWLGDVEDEELGENVLKNIQLLKQRRSRPGVGPKKMLSLEDKALLTKNLKLRSEDEQKHLAKILSGLTCFRRYRAEVKEQLAASTYYVFYRPGRVIVRQFQEAHALYFIMSGSVLVKQLYEDPILQTVEDKIIGTMEAGSMFGEVSLLHDIPRTATIETQTVCELLMLTRKDFDRVLKRTVQDEWTDIQTALTRFRYFDDFTEIDRRECCILSTIKQFKKDSVILSPTDGNLNLVHFILEGQASMMVQIKTDSNLQKYISEPKLDAHISRSTKLFRSPTMSQKIEMRPSSFADPSHRDVTVESVIMLMLFHVTFASRDEQEQLDNLHNKNEFKIQRMLANLRASTSALPKRCASTADKSVWHMIHIAYLSELACFSVNENFKGKFIVANSPVSCLQVPYYWLFQRNKMTWMQMKAFWDKVIPTKAVIFNIIKEDRKWMEYKKQLARKGTPCNSAFNVPYSVRIHDVEACDFTDL